ncbi:PREDICTED: pre-rRNA-processing protein esf1-like [Camelina sativa]|uniref:Pre-rRNA-processing protein esf1-like n=1 Tax=Camelina sativa TaxID=90675 RepID=A0ABM0T9Y6_CAMSA|nr:PREDICTED: pre-rRNA-processing protein esf1-like [Camelina sativa]
MGSNKKKKRSKGEGSGGGGGGVAEEGNQMINDPRFASAHTDPRFRSMPRRQSKIAIDSRFKPMFSDKRFTTANAPVDKRGKRRKAGKGNDLLRDFYRLDEEDNDDAKKKEKKEKEKEESGDESENEMTDLKSEAESEEESDTDKKLKLAPSLDEESNDDAESDEEAESEEVSEEEEDDTDEDNEGIYEDDGPEIPEENIPTIPEETPRLAIVNMDWKHVSAKDLYVVLNSFLPKDGRILSVAVYPSEFGLQRMKEEEIHGPVIDGYKKNEDGGDDDDEDEEEEDEDVINQKLRVYELSRLKYYFAVAECDSSATADYLYKSCDGIEFERSSNKLDLRFIPDSMEFKHPPRDIASEAPAGYEGLDFQSRALQLSKVQLSWDDDEPHRIKTLKQNFNSEQLADLEMKEFLASDESESDDEDNDSNEGMNRKKVEKRKDKYRALIESEDVDSDKDVEEENDQDMEVTFNTGLEDLRKEILKKKDKKSESVWESHLRQKREKKRARKNNQNEDDDDDDYIDRKAVKNDDGDDDFFMEEPPLKKKKKEGKTNKKKKKGLEDEVAADERSRAELELLLADGNAGEGNDLKGYNIKRKGKRGKTDISEEKIPAADLDDPRFSALLTSPAFALDPTDPQFKRSATYIRQLAAKRMEVSKSQEDVKETAPKEKEQELNSMMGSKKERHSLNSTVKSLKMKMINKESEKKQAGNAVTSSTLAQRIKKKAKDLSKK